MNNVWSRALHLIVVFPLACLHIIHTMCYSYQILEVLTG